MTVVRAVVTGGASGIGCALARRLWAQGAELVLLDRDAGGLETLAASLRALRPDGVLVTHGVDVADGRAMADVALRVRRELGETLHLLVNNAGVTAQGPFVDLPLEDLRWVMDVNFWGTVHGCKAFLPSLRAAGSATIVNVLSGFGLLGFPDKSAYCASKFAVRGFGEALRTELHGSGVRVLAVYPPAVDTPIVQRGRAVRAESREREADFLARRGWPPDEVADRILAAVAEGRSRLVIGKETWLIDLLTRIAPVLTQRLLGVLRRRIPF